MQINGTQFMLHTGCNRTRDYQLEILMCFMDDVTNRKGTSTLYTEKGEKKFPKHFLQMFAFRYCQFTFSIFQKLLTRLFKYSFFLPYGNSFNWMGFVYIIVDGTRLINTIQISFSDIFYRCYTHLVCLYSVMLNRPRYSDLQKLYICDRGHSNCTCAF